MKLTAGSIHCSKHTVCVEPLKATDKVSSLLLCNEKKNTAKSPCARQPVGSVRLLATGYRVSRLLHFLQHPVWPTLLSLDRLRLQSFFVLCLFCFCFRYYNPAAPFFFIADGYTKHQGGLDLLEDYFAVFYVKLWCDTPRLPFDLPAAASRWTLNKWNQNGEQQGENQSAMLL